MRITALLILTFANTGWLSAQVPEKIKHRFELNYPYVTNAEWRMGNDGYKVVFMGVKNLKQKIEYNKEGIMTSHYRELMKEEIPVYITQYLSGLPNMGGARVWMQIFDSGFNKYFVQNNDTIWELKSTKNNKYLVEYK